MPSEHEETTVRVDMMRCVGHGICAHLLADRISLDPWGFPIADSTPLDEGAQLRRARRAAKACPRHALLLSAAPPAAPTPAPVAASAGR